MKKILYTLFAILALSCTFVSCSDDDEDAAAPAGNPAEVAAGTYTGTWSITLDTTTVEVPGSITVAATDSDYTADITIACDQYTMKVGRSRSRLGINVTSIANIAYAGGNGESFQFNNGVDSNPLGVAFAGRIDNGKAIAYFTKKLRVGLRTNDFNYRFSGQKQ